MKDIFIEAKIKMINVNEDELARSAEEISEGIREMLWEELPEDDGVNVVVTTYIKEHSNES